MSNMAMLGCIHEAMERQGYSQKDINEMIMTMYELLDELGETILEEEPEQGFFFNSVSANEIESISESDILVEGSVVYRDGNRYDLSISEDASKYYFEDYKEDYENDLARNIKAIPFIETDGAPTLYRASTCYGSLVVFDLGNCARTNYTILKDTYDMYYAAAGGPLISGASARALALTSAFWIGKVQEGGEWDFKRLFYNYDSTTTVVIGALGYTLTAEDIGNIHYGYAGRAVYSATILKTAAGAATIIGGACRGSLLEYYCDDPVDQAAINRGINWKDTGSFK